MPRRPRASTVAPIVWRDGVHLSGTPIWCDARRRRDVCFVSSADRIARADHGQLVGTPLTLALLGARAGHLGVPLRQRFTLGTLRLELIPSGRGLGAAALHVDLGGRRVLYAGAVRTHGAAEPAEVRSCDALVVAAPVGEPGHVLPALADTAAGVAAWVRDQLAAARRPIVVVDSALDGLEVAMRLADHGLVVAGARALRDAALRVGALAMLPPIRAPGREPCVVIRVDGERVRVAEPIATALVSIRALEARAASAYAASFAWPFAADRAQLLAWIDQTSAREIYVTGACAEAIAAALGPRARTIGPPHQMALFPREATP